MVAAKKFTVGLKRRKMKKLFIGLAALALVLMVVTSTLQGIARSVIGIFQEFPSNYQSLAGYEQKLERLNKVLSNPKCTFAEVREDLRGRTEDELHYLKLILKTYKELDRKGLLKI